MVRPVPQIVAFGGGGLLDGGRQPAARRLRPRAHRRERPKVCFLPTASRRRRPLHRALLPRVLAGALRAVARLAVPPRQGRRARLRPRRAPARPGPHLRRRRQRRLAARRLARARPRRGAARVLAARHRPVRPERRLAVLVRRGGHRVPRPAAARAAGLGLLPYSNCVHYDGEPARRDELPRSSSPTGMAPGYAAERRRGAALRAATTLRARRLLAAEGAAPTGSRTVGGEPLGGRAAGPLARRARAR